ncbi:SWIM zinc finger family protein [Streptomyces sp. NRRL WC-3618]|uniref:SWIM zinc finger family protein n=1 Tax=Streptomyces sp. NRRL WC-3618 TaxID=1519490 RepID=UPI00099C4664|nr:SWIM zinc finger family protein [Streptomyces sp. NRRL WC-3618]
MSSQERPEGAEGHDAVWEEPVAGRQPLADEAEQDRPADAARRALRAARERAGQETIGTSGAAGTAGREARPGDAARAALRRSTPPADDTGSAARKVPEGRVGDGARKGGRPGDVAREALRAARGEALRARLDAEAAAAEATRRPAPPARDPRERGPREPVRDVRELLAGSIPDDDEPRPDTSTPVTVGDVLRAVASPASRYATVGVAAPEASTGASRDIPNAPNAPEAPGAADPRTTAAFRQGAPLDGRPGSPRTASSSSSVSSSMAAPGRDGELRRTFPALPASGNRQTASSGGGFAESWWGNAWVAALEEGALDAARLTRGRGYAAKGHVDAITVTPGLVLAYVQGSRPRPYRVQVRLRTLGDQEWERFLDAAVARPGHIAALLDKEMPQSLADCGAPLLPAPGDLDPRCSCPDSGHPCKHAAALCYQTARLLDADPFVLLLLRGRGEKEVLDELSRRNAAHAARAAQEQRPASFPGVRASDALAPRLLSPLPAPLPPRPDPEPPPAYPASPGGPDPFALDQLATDAAARAHTLLTTGHDPVGELTLWQDAVRLAAARPGSGLTAGTRALYSSLARGAGRTPAELARAVAAWRQGGLDGLAVLEEAWDPPAGRFDRARPLLLAADLPAFRPWRNHLTHPRGHIQLRLGQDGLWYAYESEPGHDDWWPRDTPDLDPVGALTGLGNPTDD